MFVHEFRGGTGRDEVEQVEIGKRGVGSTPLIRHVICSHVCTHLWYQHRAIVLSSPFLRFAHAFRHTHTHISSSLSPIRSIYSPPTSYPDSHQPPELHAPQYAFLHTPLLRASTPPLLSSFQDACHAQAAGGGAVHDRGTRRSKDPSAIAKAPMWVVSVSTSRVNSSTVGRCKKSTFLKKESEK